MGFGEKSGFSPNLEAMGKKIDQYHLAEFDFFTSKNHDSIVFMQFC